MTADQLRETKLLTSTNPEVVTARRILSSTIGLNKMSQIMQKLDSGFPNWNDRLAYLQRVITDIISTSTTFVPAKVEEGLLYTADPVGVEQFICDPFYLNKGTEIYPEIMKELIEMNSGKYVELVLTGAIGTGKTSIALISTAYQLYLLSLLRDPHELYDQEKSSELLIIFQSITANLAKALDYARFRSIIERSEYFEKVFPFDKGYTSELRFPNRIIVKPVSGSDTAAIGQNVIGGVIDELNYMAVIENSKSAVDGQVYDQAIQVYNSIARRRKSRFMRQGKMPGLLCLVSSRRYPGQFTDTKEEEAKNDPTIYVYDKRVWDIKPKAFIGEWFQVYKGDATRKPRIVEEHEIINKEDQEMIIDIPIEYRVEFEKDIINALREIAGIATLARFPFIMNVNAITSCTDTSEDRKLIEEDVVDFAGVYPHIYPDRIINRGSPRFCHVDLGLTSDSAGIAIGHVVGFKEINRGEYFETLPMIHIDLVLEVRPPKGGEIQFEKIRQIFYTLRENGMPIKWVSYDSWQSIDSLQILRQQGYVTGKMSIDLTMAPYQMLKVALYDHRVNLPPHPKLQRELASLEIIHKKNKIDHPPSGSKDCSDAVAGVVYGLTTQREIWWGHGVSLAQVPISVSQHLISAKKG